METSSQFGARLTQQDYEQKCRDLWNKELQDLTDKEREQAEFNLLIDYKLGVDVPQDKRALALKARNRARLMILPNIVIGFLKPGSDPTSQVLLQMVKELVKDFPRDQVAQLTDQSFEDLDRILGPEKKTRFKP